MNQELSANTTLSHYHIVAKLGAGGMGEVYRALDTRLDRAVAIKVLPAEFAKDAERVRRFEQEARATSALNHPNILTVYDIGTASTELGGAPFIVMELLEGEELRARLNDGALPVRTALEYAQQIAAGLSAAHEKGITHRDLKPENLFVTTDGRVKILDFGLAKLRPPRSVSAGSDVATQKQLTNPGTVMGTVAYMSPEQVRGEEVDHRSDIFSFGVILYEMLSGQRAFTGSSLVETMHAILKDEPPELSETNAKISPALDRIVRRCLEKKPELRFQTASDLGFALSTLTTPSSSGSNRTEAAPALVTTAITPRSSGRERLAWIGFGVASLLALLAFGTAYFRRPTLEAEPLRLFVNPPEKATRFDWPMISPDGRTLAFVATVEGKTQLWIRPLNSTTAKPLVDLRLDVAFPSWSPDGQFLSYYEERKLKKIALAGGTPVTLCNMEAAQSRGTWNRDGIIVFGAGPNGLKRVSASGGAITSVTTVDSARGEIIHGAPAFLPDGRHFLFFNTNSDPAKTGIYLGSLDGGETRQLLPLDNPVFALATNPAAKDKGYLVFARQSALLAQPYDFSRNQLTGEPVRLAEQAQISASNFAQFSVSTTGNLVLIEGTANQQLTWFDRAGKKLGTVGTLGIYSTPKLSPDEQRLAVGRLDPQTRTSDIRIFDLTRGTDSRFTFDPADDFSPLWSPDGNRLVWASNREGSHNLYQKIASGAGQDELLWKSAFRKRPLDWSADGRFIFYWETTPQTNNDVWVLPLESGARPYPWLNARFAEGPARFSPRW
jgi:Tol biopolymer transport system component